MPIFTIQRDPQYFVDPLAFLPERWVEGTPEEAANKRVPGSWLAFGEGTRVCVGQRFALQEAKITLARIFQRCERPLLLAGTGDDACAGAVHLSSRQFASACHPSMVL